MKNLDKQLQSDDGFHIVKTTVAKSGSYAGLVAWTPVIISEVDINGVAFDLTTIGLDDTIVPAGMPVFFGDGKIITRIKLVSGIAYMIKTPYIKY